MDRPTSGDGRLERSALTGIGSGIDVNGEVNARAPVRMIRSRETLSSPSAAGLYPVGEGAGYAGGIVSAALDGARAAAAILAAGR